MNDKNLTNAYNLFKKESSLLVKPIFLAFSCTSNSHSFTDHNFFFLKVLPLKLWMHLVRIIFQELDYNLILGGPFLQVIKAILH